MNSIDQQHAGYFISTDKAKLDIPCIHHYLSTDSYWAKNIPIELVQKSIEGSVCFGLYKKNDDPATQNSQVGFARVITDNATFVISLMFLFYHQNKERDLENTCWKRS